MKRKSLLVTLTLAGVCFSAGALAANLPGITVYATQEHLESRSSGDLNNFAKTFNITLENLTSKAIDLKMYCLKGYSDNGKEFLVDREDEHLAKGKLKPLGRTHGSAVFSAADDSVFHINQVKISDSCN